jgi:hypothetical protein
MLLVCLGESPGGLQNNVGSLQKSVCFFAEERRVL